MCLHFLKERIPSTSELQPRHLPPEGQWHQNLIWDPFLSFVTNLHPHNPQAELAIWNTWIRPNNNIMRWHSYCGTYSVKMTSSWPCASGWATDPEYTGIIRQQKLKDQCVGLCVVVSLDNVNDTPSSTNRGTFSLHMRLILSHSAPSGVCVTHRRLDY